MAWSVVLAIALGLMVAKVANSDKLHSLLRKKNLTLRSSYSSEWYGCLSQNRGYVVLHLKGERRLMGRPHEWPDKCDEGYFVVTEGEWLGDDGPLPLLGVEKILIPAADVGMIEFLTIVPLTRRTLDMDQKTQRPASMPMSDLGKKGNVTPPSPPQKRPSAPPAPPPVKK